MSSKEKERLLRMEEKNGVKDGIGDGLAKHLATSKLQKLFRVWKAISRLPLVTGTGIAIARLVGSGRRP
jgi:hypothetical protein